MVRIRYSYSDNEAISNPILISPSTFVLITIVLDIHRCIIKDSDNKVLFDFVSDSVKSCKILARRRIEGLGYEFHQEIRINRPILKPN